MSGGSASRDELGNTARARHGPRDVASVSISQIHRVVEDGAVWRVETDGNGKLRLVWERDCPTTYGLDPDGIRKPSGTRYPAGYGVSRRARLRALERRHRIERVACLVAERTAGITKREIATRFGYGGTAVGHYLAELRDSGRVDYRRQPHTSEVLWYSENGTRATT